MTIIAQALSAALLHFLWQGTLVAFLLWVTLSMLRTASANARYVASCVALAVMAALPAVTVWTVYEHANTFPNSSTVSTVIAAGAYASRITQGTPPLIWISFCRRLILPVWSFGVFIFAWRLAFSYSYVVALRRQGHAADVQTAAVVSLLGRRMKTTRAMRILISALAESPSVIGWLRPVILLPAAALAGLDPEQLQAVLAHEVAHIKRHDYLINLAQTLVETLLFYHPAVWWASARIRHERELCCDDSAVAACGNAIVYARALTSLERLRAATPRLAMGIRPGSLQHRIERLAGVTPQLQPSKLPGLAALTLGVASLAMTVHLATAQSGQMTDLPKMRDEWGVTVSTAGHWSQRSRVSYPELAYQSGIEGPVTVEAILDREGGVADARVLSGPPELRKAALESVLQWRFANAVGGEMQEIRITFHHAEAQAQHTLLSQILVTQSDMGASKKALDEQPGAQRLVLETQLARLGEQMLEYRKRFVEGDPQVSESLPDTNSSWGLQRVLVGLEVEREEMENLLCAGSRLARVEIAGFPEREQPDLIAKLPVRIGETLSAASIEHAVAKMNGLAPSIVFRLQRLNDSDAVLRIAPFGMDLDQLK